MTQNPTIAGDDSPTILALGSVNADFQVRVQRWPDPGETLLAEEFVVLGGGKSANVAYLARRLGLRAMLMAHVGDDPLADHALRGLQDVAVDLTHTRRLRGCSTGVAMISVRPDGDKTIILAANANAAWERADAQEAVDVINRAPRGSVLATNLEIPIFIVEAAAKAARDRSLKVLLDPSPAECMTPELYALADVLTPNRSEAQQLSARRIAADADACEVAMQLRSRGPGAVLLKLSGDCVVASAERTEHLHALPAEPVDTTGAGDAFAAAAAVALLEGRSLRDVALLAMAASSLAIEHYGSQPAYPRRAELDRRYDALVAANAG